ncbi:lactate/malate family dehydrogenase [Corynebacterium glucuronolyticum]|uniref:lactate/malate family dehydrogenase n=1 Tax=Corynebacterium glucuronolyticum TaxID=39791 RepID=UPI00191E1683|nr:L-lactate dehydrogenase [Corynebacterium glucuronolyticum]MCT1442605.1 L-lactate dehydrogenase [Corynebacterium glucuronolyticum]MCT1563302.1 L-lactate dehydrogenase [Corynebacterium glucuronolyticum]QQU88137.1 L-lactate dehydrogenase [Corynebacterium glucuronolyticum]
MANTKHGPRLVIIGLGHVGSQVLTEAVRAGIFAEIVTIDKKEGVAFGEALDHHQASALPGNPGVKLRSGDYEDCKDADVIICAAGPSMVPDGTGSQPDRTELTSMNAKEIRQVMTDLTAVTRDPALIFITNPLDTMVFLAENEFDYPRCFGTGTMLDSSRLRRIVADRLGISPETVSGYMMGEHGMSAFPVLSRLTACGIRADEFKEHFGVELDPEEIGQSVVSAAYDVFNAKGWTNAAIARSAVLLARAVLFDEKALWPVCSTLRGEYGLNGDVALSIPSVIGAEGVEKRFAVSLNEWEQEALAKTVASIQQTIKDAQVTY